MSAIELDDLDDLPAGFGRPAPTPTSPPAPPERQHEVEQAQQVLSEAQVRHLVDANDAIWRERCESLQRQIDVLSALQQVPRKPPSWRMTATTDNEGRITEIVAEPVTMLH